MSPCIIIVERTDTSPGAPPGGAGAPNVCERKAHHATRRLARDELRRLKKRGARHLNVYACGCGTAWCVGHRPGALRTRAPVPRRRAR